MRPPDNNPGKIDEAFAANRKGIQSSKQRAAKHKRAVQMKRLVERLAKIYGLSGFSTNISTEIKNGCRLTREGITIMLNPELGIQVHTRNWHGMRGDITLDEIDTILALQEVRRALDYTDPSYFSELEANPRLPNMPRRFFNSSVDDIAVGLCISQIPLVARRHKAFVSRYMSHVIIKNPLHVQFMNALKLYIFEDDPDVIMDTSLIYTLGIIGRHSDPVIEFKQRLQDRATTFEKRHKIADELIWQYFEYYLQCDQKKHEYYDSMDIYEEMPSYGASKQSLNDDYSAMINDQVPQRVELLLSVMEGQDVEQMIKDRNEDAGEDDSVGLPILTKGSNANAGDGEVLAETKATDYQDAVSYWGNTIEQIAEVFVNISSPKNKVAVPRYRARIAGEGSRLSPQAMLAAYVQLKSGHNHAIWQPKHMVSRTQILHFNGLDVYLLLDISGSMKGVKAKYAAAMGLCLIEGLQLAVHKASLDATQESVDVRAQLIAFGAGWAEVTPLTREANLDEKQEAHFLLLHPNNNQTMISGALKHVLSGAQEFLERDILCLIVSDGLFADNLNAYRIVRNMPPNAYVGHINVGEFSGVPITPNYELVQDANVLPEKLKSLLVSHMNRRV